ncbi:MAG TPA: hypothetical protein VKA26_12655 [Ignavibacteriaceae bacterium]|nr:hypothetical protein [Ignavibacteriaceae bacterium]
MKRNGILSFLLISLVFSNSISAQDFSIDAGADLVSRYIWRGADINNQANIQPFISIGYSGLQLGFWGSYGLIHLNSTDENYKLSSEIDTWLSYTVSINNSINITALLTDYYFPSAGVGIGNFDNYDNVNGPGAHTIEAGLTITGRKPLPLSLSGYVNVYNDKGKNTYFQLDYSTSVKDFNVTLSSGAAAGSKDNPGYYGTDKFSFVHLGLKVSKSVKITESFSLPVYCSFILNPKSELAFFVLGISI